jgi:hypothetical protein
LLVAASCAVSRAQEVKRIPPPGVSVPDADRAELQAGGKELGEQIDALRASLKGKPELLELLPDVQIFQNAVRYALTYDEFFNAREIPSAKKLLQEGLKRAKALREGQAPWTTSAGLVVRGYVSRIDGSVQPYGLVVPPSVAVDPARPRRLDIWYHGRGETLSEVNFLADRQRNPGEFVPPDTIVLHPYGRYCNANRFAGEIDTFEALDSVKKHYAIDGDRILVRGFSMGGASTWMFATHYAGLWRAAAPGAGFSETAGFLHIRDLDQVPWYERKLWHQYDSIDYAINMFNCPLVAYSGQNDPQKQAADMMDKALADVGITMVHVIGPGARHFYVPPARAEINRRLDAIADRPRDEVPAHVKFTTWTLAYSRMLWVQLDGLEHHWERALVDAQILDPNTVQLTTQNVTALTLAMPSGRCPLDETRRPTVRIDGQEVKDAAPILSDRSWIAHFRMEGARWTSVESTDDGSLRKRPGLQGPIDDAFMNSFIMVRPTSKAMNENTGKWIAGEMRHAIEHWRRQFRGEARVKDDADVTDADIASSNLVLWGDPSSNRVLAKIADRLPIEWAAGGVRVGDKRFNADHHVPVMIYPNPLNPRHYVVLNSGFTFREFDYLNNARQTPKLPDWAIVDIAQPATPKAPGGIADAGFFGERWELQAER